MISRSTTEIQRTGIFSQLPFSKGGIFSVGFLTPLWKRGEGEIFATFLVAIAFVCGIAPEAYAQSTPEKVVVSYPSKSITNFPILETAKQKGFFQKEALNVSVVYMRGGIDIKALLTGDADFGTGSTTAVTAFVAGAPLRVIMSFNAYVDQGLYAQPKYRSLAQLKGQAIGSLNPGGLVDTLLRRILIQGGLQPDKDVVILNMGGTPERYAALKSGTIAASMLSSPYVCARRRRVSPRSPPPAIT